MLAPILAAESMISWHDPRKSWVPMVGLFIVAFLLVIDLSRPKGVLGSGLWIPLLYGVVPVTIGVLAYVNTRAGSGRPIPSLMLIGLAVWGLIGAFAALGVTLIIGLGRPTPSGPPSTVFSLLTGVLTFIIPTGTFVGWYGEAGRRPRRMALAIVGSAPVVTTLVLAILVRLSW